MRTSFLCVDVFLYEHGFLHWSVTLSTRLSPANTLRVQPFELRHVHGTTSERCVVYSTSELALLSQPHISRITD